MSWVTTNMNLVRLYAVAGDDSIDPPLVVAAGAEGVILYSTNEVEDDQGFETLEWQQAARFDYLSLNDVAFGSGRFFMACDSGNLYRSVGGQEWLAEISGVTVDLNAVAYVSGEIWLAAGDDGTIIRSTDNGRNW